MLTLALTLTLTLTLPLTLTLTLTLTKQAMRGAFYDLAAASFDVARLEPRDLDPEHPGIEVHCLTRK